MSWNVAVAGEAALVTSIVDNGSLMTTLYNAGGDAYKDIDDAIAHVQQLDRNGATAAKVNLVDGASVAKYQNFTSTAQITKAAIETSCTSNVINLTNSGDYTALEITGADGSTYYMVFQQV